MILEPGVPFHHLASFLKKFPQREAAPHARRLSSLRRLVLWGSEVSDHCMWDLECLSSLTALDLSLTRCAAPPVLPTLRHLSMIHCQLDVVGEDREALWLDMG